jgi:hypothetical protein
MRDLRLLAVVVGLFSGCAPLGGPTRDPAYVGRGPGAMQLPPLVVYQDSAGPLSYRTTPVAPGPLREVRGEACQSGLMFPVGLILAAIESGNTARAPGFLSTGWGEGGYAEAVASALAAAPSSRLVAVRADMNTKIILGVWRQQCVRVLASVVPVR